MKHILLLCLCLSFGFFVVSCEYNNEETLYPPEVCDTTVVTYAAAIAPIIENRCFECHDEEAAISGIPLEGYDNLKAMVDAERLIGAIRHEVGFSFMPKDRPALPECEILKIEKWVAEGALDN